MGDLTGRVFRGAALISETNFPTRAAAAFRFSVGAADGGTQFHQRLREVTGFFRIDGGKSFPDAGFHGGQIDRGGVVRQPGEDPQHIAVHSRDGEVKGDGADSARSILADTGQRQNRIIFSGKLAVVALLNDLRGLFQIPHPAVVAKSLPQLVQSVVITVCQGLHGGQSGEEAGVVALDSLHPCLLEHDFRQPDMVRLFGFPPWQAAVVFPIPRKQQLGEHIQIQIIHIQRLLMVDILHQKHRGCQGGAGGEDKKVGKSEKSTCIFLRDVVLYSGI